MVSRACQRASRSRSILSGCVALHNLRCRTERQRFFRGFVPGCLFKLCPQTFVRHPPPSRAGQTSNKPKPLPPVTGESANGRGVTVTSRRLEDLVDRQVSRSRRVGTRPQQPLNLWQHEGQPSEVELPLANFHVI